MTTVDARPALQVDEGRGQVGAPGPVGTDLVLLADQGPQRRLLLAGQPSQLGGLAAQLVPAPLDQAEHLQHAVVDRPGQPGPLGGGCGVALGAVPLGGHALERLAR